MDIFRSAQAQFASEACKCGDQSGTTATVAMITKESIVVAYVGDSRACVVHADGHGALPSDIGDSPGDEYD